MHTFEMTINQPGDYYISTTASGKCADGMKMKIVISGTAKGDNKIVNTMDSAPASAHQPEAGASYTAHGKGVYWQRAMDNKLDTPCTADGYCLDAAESKGSCYYTQ